MIRRIPKYSLVFCSVSRVYGRPPRWEQSRGLKPAARKRNKLNVSIVVALAMLWLQSACVDTGASSIVDLSIETGFAFTNFSTQFYAALQLRPSSSSAVEDDYFATPLLAPGATVRERFLDSLNDPCPFSMDLRVLVYARANADLPIGLDEGETVLPAPMVAGEIFDVPACGNLPSETYTIVNWDAPEGMAVVKLAQDLPIEQTICDAGLFDNPDGTWNVNGVTPELANLAPPPLAASTPIDGRVTLADGSGLENIVVVLRSRFRIRLGDDDPDNDPDAGFGDPILFDVTDIDGAFSLNRPAGAYRVEFFSDDFAFRPAIVDLETPSDTVSVIAEALP